jgi:2'-5' RNA ligase
MRRLFIGVQVDSEQQRDLQEVCRKLKISSEKKETYLRWTPPENWHVTLQFLGPVDESRIPDIEAALSRAASRCSAAEIRASGIGAFPEERRARVLYAGVARSQALLDLQSQVEAELNGLGFPGEDSDYHPHLTIARLRSAGSVSDLISPFVRKDFAKIRLHEIVLFESVQRGNFPVYIPLYRAPLGPNTAG